MKKSTAPFLSIFAAIVGIFVFLTPVTSHAWGELAHQVIVEIAKRDLSEKATEELSRLLKDPDKLGPLSNWPDFAREQNSWKKTRNWHHASFLKSLSTPCDYWVTNERKNGDLLFGLVSNEIILRKKRNLSIQNLKINPKEAILFFLHFVPELHQPFHVGLKSDVGGKMHSVQYHVIIQGGKDQRFRRRENSLHELWDKDLGLEFLKSQNLLRKNRQFLQYDVVKIAQHIANDPRFNQTVDVSGTYLDWIYETQKILLSAYPDISHPGEITEVDSKYLQEQGKLVLRQWYIAGLRLAASLNSIFEDQPLTTQQLELQERVLKRFENLTKDRGTVTSIEEINDWSFDF